MHRLYISGLMVLCLGSFVLAQPDPATDPDCYQQWERVFKDRSAYAVEDGEYANVVVSIRQKVKKSEDDYIMETITKCYTGKAVVHEKRVVEIYIKVVDNTYEKLDRKYKYFNLEATIDNGITRNIVTEEGDIINVIFPEKLKPKSPDKAISKAESGD